MPVKRGTKVKVDENKKAIDDLSKALQLKSNKTEKVSLETKNDVAYEKNEFIAKFDIKKAI